MHKYRTHIVDGLHCQVPYDLWCVIYLVYLCRVLRVQQKAAGESRIPCGRSEADFIGAAQQLSGTPGDGSWLIAGSLVPAVWVRCGCGVGAVGVGAVWVRCGRAAWFTDFTVCGWQPPRTTWAEFTCTLAHASRRSCRFVGVLAPHR